MSVTVRPVASKADRKAYVERAYRLNLADPNWVPPLKDEVRGLITPGKNPCSSMARPSFSSPNKRQGRRQDLGAGRPARARAYGRGSGPVGHVRSEDEAVARALLAAAEGWLRARA